MYFKKILNSMMKNYTGLRKYKDGLRFFFTTPMPLKDRKQMPNTKYLDSDFVGHVESI